jgi:2-aminoethylphosphonate transport system permease protein
MATTATALDSSSRTGCAQRMPRWLWIVPPLLMLACIFFYPLALIIKQSFVVQTGLFSQGGSFGLGTYAEVLSSSLFYDALTRTIEIALASTAGCLILGFSLSVVVAFVPFPGSSLVSRFVDTVLSVPSFLIALSFTFLYGSSGFFNFLLMDLFHTTHPPLRFLYTPWGVILAEITFFTPFVMRSLLAGFSQIDPAHIEVANSLGAGPGRIVRQIIFPASIPALLAGGSLCLLLTLNEFGIVFFIGAKGVITLPMLIYSEAIQQFDYASACVIAIVNIVLSLTLYSLYKLLLTRMGGGNASMV